MPGTVYVIDDDDAVRDSIRLLLECAGFRAEEFATSAEFLQRAAPQEGHSCIVTDMHMPGVSGLALIETIRRRDALIPIIAMTGRPDASLRDALREAGITLLVKPFPPDDLIGAVAKALRSRLH